MGNVRSVDGISFLYPNIRVSTADGKEKGPMDPQSPITRGEHEEFRRRMEEDHERTNKRLLILEETVKRIGDLTVSIEKLATNMQNMTDVQKEQGQKLEDLESRDGKMWRKIVGHLATSIISIILGYIFARIGIV